MAVAEEDRPLPFTREHSFLVRLRFRSKAFDVGQRRSVADEDPVQLGLLGKVVEPVEESRAERFARRRQCSRQEALCARRGFGLLAQPPFDVAADAGDRRQRLEQLGGFARPRAEGGVVAAE